MAWYNLFTIDKDGEPLIVSVETDNEKLANTVQFDKSVQMLPAELRQRYFNQIKKKKFNNTIIEPIRNERGM